MSVSNDASQKTGPAVKLPKPNKGQVIPKGLWLPFLHNHTQPKRSA